MCNAADVVAYNRAVSPLKQPLLYLPPPPQHPPPSSNTAGPLPQRRLSTDNDDDIYSRIPSSDVGDTYPPSLPPVDYYAAGGPGRYDDVVTEDDCLEDSLPPRRPPRAPTSTTKMVAASPQFQRRLCDQVTGIVSIILLSLLLLFF